ncbi:hypothetical protein [Hymenobacter glaciei]|uniref:hypothetical protein n=1 Tax=Hymenobacter glaciei TaxID=877209 RepID=UPI0031EE6512
MKLKTGLWVFLALFVAYLIFATLTTYLAKPRVLKTHVVSTSSFPADSVRTDSIKNK